jgi:type III restriction enzyme
MFKLKNYQERTLEVLKNYLEQARFKSAEVAYNQLASELNLKPYKPLKNIEQVPFICLRLPTGGGKTFLSANSISIASEKLRCK